MVSIVSSECEDMSLARAWYEYCGMCSAGGQYHFQARQESSGVMCCSVDRARDADATGGNACP
jgi:hypothetical protein